MGSNPTGLRWYEHFNILIYCLQYMHTYSSIHKVKIIEFKMLCMFHNEVKHHLMQVTQTLKITTNLIGILIVDSPLNTYLFLDNLAYLLVDKYIF